ncbi:MAG: hypothetical protein FD135_4120 [Comamonadaceae bacterium]|nr:MAG: hypothetical protein FD135_4120 [Comamonadaceae bacterium]
MKLSSPPNPSVFPERKQVTAALQRAAEKASLIAEQTGTKLVVVAPAPKTTPPKAAPQ